MTEDTCPSLFRNRRGEQGIHQVRGRPVKDPVRDLLQGYAGADNAEIPGRVLYGQGPERDTRGILAVFLPFRPAAEKSVPHPRVT